MGLSQYGFTPKKGAKLNEPSEDQKDVTQSDVAPLVPNHPGLQRRVVTNSSTEASVDDQASSHSTTAAQSDRENGDIDETDLQLTQEELQVFTQHWNPFDKDDEEDIPLHQPEPIDFSQSQPTDSIADHEVKVAVDTAVEVIEDQDVVLALKRHRPNEQPASIAHNKEPEDTENTWNLSDNGTWKIFKKEEQFCTVPTVGYPKMVFTIKDFFNDPKVGKMAICHVAILARETFLGKGNPDFNESNFSDKFGSKYMSCRKSQNRPLRKLRKLAVGIVDFKSTGELQVHYDHPDAETKGCGWTIGCSFDASFPFDVSEPLHAADFFAGGGGMSCGLENAGFKVTHAVDNDPTAVATLRHNHPETAVFCQEVGQFLDEAKKSSGMKGSYNCNLIVHGHFSSPCQGFSRMNTTGSEASREKNNKLCLTFPKGVIGLRMTTGSFENVTGMLDPKRVQYIQKTMLMFLMNGYQVRVGVVDSSRYGDPQQRERVIIMVSRYGWALPDLPKPTYGPGTPNLLLRTPRDAIGDLEDVEPRKTPGRLMLEKPWRGLFASTKVTDHNDAIEVDHHVQKSHDGNHPIQREYSDTDTLKADEPANTVLCGHAIKHYSKDRALTNLETARLQSFPDHWQFAGNPRQVQKQIGNAVPVGLATAIAREIRKVYKLMQDDSVEPSP